MDKERIIKSNQEQAVASWINYLNQIRINQVVESLQQQNENLQDAVSNLKDTGISFSSLTQINFMGTEEQWLTAFDQESLDDWKDYENFNRNNSF